MGFRQRLLILIFFTIIFAILAPYLILYGRGYRYDFRNLRFDKTGNLFVSTVPGEATVAINRRLPKPKWYEPLLFYKKLLGLTKLGGTTPAVFDTLFPDDYLITIKKDGYQTWEKRLKIKAKETTFVRGIYLFLSRPTMELIKEGIVKISVSPDQKKLILVKSNQTKNLSEIYLFNLDDQSIVNLGGVDFSPIFIKWAATNNKFLISSSEEASIKDSFLFNLLTPGQISTLGKIKLDLKNLKWGKNDFYLYGQNGNLIYRLNLNDLTSQPIFNLNLLFKKSSLRDWLVKDNYLYWLRENELGELFLEKHKLEDSRRNYQIESLLIKELKIPVLSSKFADQQLINGQFLVLSSKGNFLIIDTLKNDSSAILFNEKGQEPLWLDKDFIFTNQFEFWQGSLYEKQNEFQPPSSFNEELITRLSRRITQIAWHPGKNYLFYLTENSIGVIELDKRKKRNSFQLLNLKKIDQFFLSPDSRFIYLIGENAGQKGLFRIKIQ